MPPAQRCFRELSMEYLIFTVDTVQLAVDPFLLVGSKSGHLVGHAAILDFLPKHPGFRAPVLNRLRQNSNGYTPALYVAKPSTAQKRSEFSNKSEPLPEGAKPLYRCFFKRLKNINRCFFLTCCPATTAQYFPGTQKPKK